MKGGSLYLPLGVITNLRSGRNLRGKFSAARLQEILGADGLVRESREFGELAAILGEFKREGVKIIGVNGGDGTFGRLIEAMLQVWGRQQLPALFPLCGGTMNMLAGDYGLRGNPASLLERFRRAAAGRGERLGFFHQKTLCLRVSDRENPLYGFVWGTGMAYSFLREYYTRAPASAVNAFFTTVTLIGGGPLPLERFRRAWRPIRARFFLDGKALLLERVRIAVAGTLGKLVLWFSPFAEGVGGPQDGFGFMINAMPMAEVLRRLWALSRGQYQGKLHFSKVAQSVRLETRDGFVLDGELFEPEAEVSLEIGLGPPVSIAAFAGRSPAARV